MINRLQWICSLFFFQKCSYRWSGMVDVYITIRLSEFIFFKINHYSSIKYGNGRQESTVKNVLGATKPKVKNKYCRHGSESVCDRSLNVPQFSYPTPPQYWP